MRVLIIFLPAEKWYTASNCRKLLVTITPNCGLASRLGQVLSL